MMMYTFALFLSFLCLAFAAETQPSLVVGRGLAEKEADVVSTMDQLNRGARNLVGIAPHSSSPLDKLNVMIKNVDCAACMEAPDDLPIRRLRHADSDRKLSPRQDVFVTALNCDATDPYQVWNMLSLEPTGTWFFFESAETGECMQLVGVCSPDGSLYDIEMGPCDHTNLKAFWGFTGIGEIVNFECFRENWESDLSGTYHSTPDIFLEAQCTNTGGIDRLDLSSHSADSQDQAQNVWIAYPTVFELP